MILELITENRSYRRFHQNVSIAQLTLNELVNLARLSPSAANRQPLKFILSNTPEQNALIFNCLAWAGYIKEWGGPREGERPSAYIIILGDTSIADSFGIDPGIAAQSIMLGAVEKGLGGCMVASLQKDKLRKALAIPGQYEILLALALGKPLEQVVIEDVDTRGDIKYWRDGKELHHVPKRKLEDLIVKF